MIKSLNPSESIEPNYITFARITSIDGLKLENGTIYYYKHKVIFEGVSCRGEQFLMEISHNDDEEDFLEEFYKILCVSATKNPSLVSSLEKGEKIDLLQRKNELNWTIYRDNSSFVIENDEVYPGMKIVCEASYRYLYKDIINRLLREIVGEY